MKRAISAPPKAPSSPPVTPRSAASARNIPTTRRLPAPIALRSPISDRLSSTLVDRALVSARAEAMAAMMAMTAIRPETRSRIAPSESATRRMTRASERGAAGDLDRKVVSRAQTQGRDEPGSGESLERTRLRETIARPVTGDAPVRVEAARPGPEPRLPTLDLPVEPGAAQEHGPAGGSARGRPEEPRRHVQDRCHGQDVVLPEILADGRQVRGVEVGRRAQRRNILATDHDRCRAASRQDDQVRAERIQLAAHLVADVQRDVAQSRGGRGPESHGRQDDGPAPHAAQEGEADQTQEHATAQFEGPP